ncbi:extracellular solute-binding protein [Uliginosibacterium sediminicola]|uniref:Extracellular solute-binding protein n=1 Tax=Uliginosibacterium sediminicola TaxID=2024550 RepID=A0ABU9YWI0_9RHOO
MPIFRLCLLLALLLPTLTQAEVLRVLSWPGYVTNEATHAFEQQYGVNVELVIISSDEELWKRASLNEGRNFDLIALNTAELKRYIEANLVQPLNMARIPNARNQIARFRHAARIPGLVSGGKQWAVPFTYSAMGLIYNRKLLAKAPDSMSALWDPAFRGRILLHDSASHNFSLTALSLGIRTPFQLDQTQFNSSLKRLLALRDNLPLFYSTPEEAVEIMRAQDIALLFGNYGDQQVRLLRQAGLDVAQIMPREGALAWLDCWAMLQGASNPRLAEAWINHMLTPAVAQQLSSQQGLSNTLRETQNTALRDKDKIIWLEPVEDATQRAYYWERLRAGTRPPPGR